MMERNCIGLDKRIFSVSENENPLSSTVPTLAGNYSIIILLLSAFYLAF